ncbi:gluconokinase [Rhizobiaceae bacterium n13]|uniref:Gluconokinase n=1 Tax=Ferirhizobium litorale TaxID=2927786 RepID=A0AAE3U3D1_9HYPH|nr:gluconokinase [Fererhizobium litorale]MDI7863480.1 gluconokinase [Fererhizobium litorale]MDI7922243.1 gluconokinase [Fererhizobium litorale]
MRLTETNTLPVLVVMGVSGCGKSSVGEKLAAHYSVPFVEGDQLHPASNVAKMAEGTPLTDADRTPWLAEIGSGLRAAREKGEGIVLSCSALKRSYRDQLRAAAGDGLAFVYLEGSRSLLESRMGARKGHFMPTSLLESQLQTLEVPSAEPDVVTVSIDDDLDGIVANAVHALEKLRSGIET